MFRFRGPQSGMIVLPTFHGTVEEYKRVHGLTSVPSALCPDLLRYEQIGEADNLRGRVVRAFFWLTRVWPVG